jgi:hypothetical protein
MKFFTFFIFVISSITILFANTNPLSLNPMMDKQPSINIDNTILIKINNSSISVMDVKKKMDLFIKNKYPELANSPYDKYQFYTNSWKAILSEMINTELLLLEAKDREIKIPDGEVRKEMESRFGPNISAKLEKNGISYVEAWDIVKNEMIVERMRWYFIHNKASQKVTPQVIRKSYQLYCKNNPPIEKWKYQFLSIRSKDNEKAKKASEEITALLTKINPDSFENLQDDITKIEQKITNVSIKISKDYEMTGKEISKSHVSILNSLLLKKFSAPITEISRLDKKNVYRFFQLKDHEIGKLPSFSEMANQLKNELFNKEYSEESKNYFAKLRKRYGFEEKNIKKMIPDNTQPFSLQ